MSLKLKNLSGVIGHESGDRLSLSITDGLVTALGDDTSEGQGDSFDCSGLTAWPGFIDVHIHGADGVDVNEAGTEGLLRVSAFLARHGVTAWTPTLVPDSDENYRRVISAIDEVMNVQLDKPVAQAVGVHYEGVFANEKMCGALRPQYFRQFTGNELQNLPRLNRGSHMTTFAPEVDGGIALIEELNRQGWIASIGHTRADVETLERAFRAGAKHVTHFFNAMTGMHHRDIGVVGWALSNRDVTFDIIADGHHVHPTMLEYACRSKSPESVSLISDSVAPTGLGDGAFTIWGESITVRDGLTRNERGSIAGSVITMLDAVRRMLSLGFSDAEVSRMASRNPARLLGLDETHGTIDVGRRADIVLLDAAGDVRMTLIGGEIAFNAA
jgi:N-acetylglucosamine-6-phosphate deacetylase